MFIIVYALATVIVVSKSYKVIIIICIWKSSMSVCSALEPSPVEGGLDGLAPHENLLIIAVLVSLWIFRPDLKGFLLTLRTSKSFAVRCIFACILLFCILRNPILAWTGVAAVTALVICDKIWNYFFVVSAEKFSKIIILTKHLSIDVMSVLDIGDRLEHHLSFRDCALADIKSENTLIQTNSLLQYVYDAN